MGGNTTAWMGFAASSRGLTRAEAEPAQRRGDGIKQKGKEPAYWCGKGQKRALAESNPTWLLDFYFPTPSNESPFSSGMENNSITWNQVNTLPTTTVTTIRTALGKEAQNHGLVRH